MKRLACPCPALPRFWERGSPFMAEGSRPQAPGQRPSLDLQVLRAHYQDLRRQQRTQAHLVVLPKGGTASTPAESMISAVWINKERKNSLSLDEADSEVTGMIEEADRSCHQGPESPWHTHLEMHRLVQTFPQEANHQVKPKVHLVGSEQSLPPEGDLHLSEHNQETQQGSQIPEAAECQCRGDSTQREAAECQCRGDSTQREAAGSNLKASSQLPPSIKNSHRAGKPTHYPFPQRKTPRISQAARNLGLYGPA